MSRQFELGDILSVTTGRLVSRRHVTALYDLMGFMTGENLMTHQLPRAMDACAPELIRQHPWLAGNVFKACLTARNLAAEEIKSTGMFYSMLPWLSDDLRRAYDVMGPNMWPYGATANRKELEAMLRWSFEQGLAPRHGTVEEIFAPGMTEPRWDTNHSP